MVEDNFAYYEAEDELDTIVDVNGKVIIDAKNKEEGKSNKTLFIDAFGSIEQPHNSDKIVGKPLLIEMKARLELIQEKKFSDSNNATTNIQNEGASGGLGDSLRDKSGVNAIQSLKQLLNPDIKTLLPLKQDTSENVSSLSSKFKPYSKQAYGIAKGTKRKKVGHLSFNLSKPKK